MNRSCLSIWVLLAAAVLVPMHAQAQAEHSATQEKASLWVGADYANFSASFRQRQERPDYLVPQFLN